AFGYSNSTNPNSAAGWVNSAGMLLTKYKINTSDTLKAVNVVLGSVNDDDSIYAVVLNAAGAIISQSDLHVTHSWESWFSHSFALNNPPVLNNAEFYVGVAQKVHGSFAVYPVGTQPENPVRPGAYYQLAGLSGGVPTESTGLGRFMINAIFASDSLAPDQFEYLAANSTHLSTTYTDLGSSGTSITTNYSGSAMSFDNDNSSIQNIGFNFNYNCKTYSQFILNSNGFIKLGTNPSATNNFNVLSSSDSNTIAPFNCDLEAGTSSPEFRVFTSGTPGSRICTIQFKNLRDKTTHRYNNINFQIKIYEANKAIEFLYGSFTSSGIVASPLTTVAGIKGSYTYQSVNSAKAAATSWSSSTFIDGPYTSNSFDNNNTVLPASGTVLRFVPAKDLRVKTVYATGKIPLLATYQQGVNAWVENLG
ncbi:MAG TPA: hypothetical protein VFV08_14920, partial [Puia sp.]|nr:hypothetical protein [Puia sp.]